MKRALTSIALLLLALPVLAQVTVRERDVLLTSAGVVYTVEAVHDSNVDEGRSSRYLRMIIQQGNERTTAEIPAAQYGGLHGQPALAYDSQSETLFVFWQEQLHQGLASRLLFASYHDGVWSDVSELDSVTWRLRRNLRIAVTRTIQTTDDEGQTVQVPQLVVHAVWWEETGDGEWARYAMLGIDEGLVTSTDFRYLKDFIESRSAEALADAEEAGEVLRHPAIFSNSSRDSVEVIFGDVSSRAMRRLRIKPALNGRLRIPIGVRGGSLRNADLNVSSGSRVAAIIEDETIALYAVSAETVDYVVYRNGEWTKQRSIALTEELSREAAVDALRRMVAAQ